MVCVYTQGVEEVKGLAEIIWWNYYERYANLAGGRQKVFAGFCRQEARRGESDLAIFSDAFQKKRAIVPAPLSNVSDTNSHVYYYHLVPAQGHIGDTEQEKSLC